MKYIYKNELDKACLVHDAACVDSKDLAKRTISNKTLEKDTAYETAMNSIIIKKYKNVAMQPLTIFSKSLIVDVRLGSKYASEYNNIFFPESF